MISNLIAFVIVLGVLVLFHEFGHFIMARLFGVGVEKFSIGFGPKLMGKKVGLTEYRLSAIPLGGYVKMVGESDEKEISPDEIPISFTHKHVLKKMAIVAAGPAFNILLAAAIFFGLYRFSGMPILDAVVGEVGKGSPALMAGIETGDRIVVMDGVDIRSWDDMAKAIAESQGHEIETLVLRGDQRLSFRVQPTLSAVNGEKTERYMIGISTSGEFHKERLSTLSALSKGISQSLSIVALTIATVVDLFRGEVSAKTLGGPIQIARMAGDQAREGLLNLLVFIAWLSVNLAVINFLPIPVLDGGHFVFFLIEAVIGRPVSSKVREKAQQAGMFLLLMLMVFVFYNDIMNLFLR